MENNKQVCVAENRELSFTSDRPTGGLVPTDLPSAYSLATRLANSGLVPAAMRGRADDILVSLLLGMESGIPPMQAIQGTAVVNGRPSFYGELAVAVVRSHSLCEELHAPQYKGEGLEMSCRLGGKRRGDKEPTFVEYSMKDARVAGLLDKDPWRKHPKDMLFYKCFHRLKTYLWPDVLKGIAIKEVISDEQEQKEDAAVQEVEVIIEGKDGKQYSVGEDAHEPQQQDQQPAETPRRRKKKAEPAPVPEPTPDAPEAKAEPEPEPETSEQAPADRPEEDCGIETVGDISGDAAGLPCQVVRITFSYNKPTDSYIYTAHLASGAKLRIAGEDVAREIKAKCISREDRIVNSCVLFSNEDGVVGARVKLA